ncbi:MAG: hypothetical protein ACM3SY_05065, partial [Candidatus Omnitrophota bacterium]
WRKPDFVELLKTRTSILGVLHNKRKGMPFLSMNRLIFLLQGNIVKNKPHTQYERWFTFAEKTRNDKNDEQDFEEYKNDGIFSEIIRRLNRNALKPDDIVYIENEKKFWEEVNRLERGIYEDGREEGREEGIEIGREEGIEEGKKEGIEKGREKEKNETAQNMLKKGFDIDTIMEITGLDKNKIQEITTSMQ